MPGFGLGFGIRWRRPAAGGGTPTPDGALADDDGTLLADDDGAFLLEEA